MTHPPLRRPFRRLLRRRLLGIGLAAAASTFAGSLQAHEFFAPHFTVIHPWTRASAPGATTAIVSMTIEDVSVSDRLIGAITPLAAGAEMGGEGRGPALDIAVPAGQTTTLSESGVHLRLVGLKMPIEMAREYPLTLVFEKAGKLQAKLLVDFEAGTGPSIPARGPAGAPSPAGAGIESSSGHSAVTQRP
jgi:copper(I)-binding protein